MKTAIVFHSDTGNTAKVGAAIAEAIADRVAPDEVTIGSIEDAPSLEGCDPVFVGMPVVKFGASEDVQRFLKEECAGRRVALFVTHAACDDFPELQPWLQACREAASGTRLQGLFRCQGQLAEPIKQWMLGSGMPDLVRFAELSASAEGQPDDAALERARVFARDVVAGGKLLLASS